MTPPNPTFKSNSHIKRTRSLKTLLLRKQISVSEPLPHNLVTNQSLQWTQHSILKRKLSVHTRASIALSVTASLLAQIKDRERRLLVPASVISRHCGYAGGWGVVQELTSQKSRNKVVTSHAASVIVACAVQVALFAYDKCLPFWPNFFSVS